MWERIGASSAVIIGAVVLFLLFSVTLYLMERGSNKKHKQRRTTPYLIPNPECRNSHDSKNVKHLRSSKDVSRYVDKDLRKIS